MTGKRIRIEDIDPNLARKLSDEELRNVTGGFDRLQLSTLDESAVTTTRGGAVKLGFDLKTNKKV